jgi:hypothetical protein
MWWAQLLNQIAAIHGTGVAASTNSYESIATVTVGSGGTGSISFSSIPSTYKHLQIRALVANNNVGYGALTRLNSDTTGSNYNTHRLQGNGSAAAAGYDSSDAYPIYYTGGSSGYAGAVLDILDYADTNKYTTMRALGGYDTNGAGYVYLGSALWKNTAAVNAITMVAPASSLFLQYSSFALYGIKG